MKNYRNTKLYKTLDSYTACSIAEGFSGEDHDADDELTAWQWLVDTGLCWQLQGWYGQSAYDLIERGLVKAPKQDKNGSYGVNAVRSV